jgi:hypothetical protein
MSTTSRQIVLAVGLAGLLVEAVVSHPSLAQEKIALFKVVTPQDEIVIGLTKDELARMPGKDSGAVQKVLNDSGEMNVWQYAVRRGVSGEFEQAPLKKIGLSASDDIHVEPYKTQLRVVPITEVNMLEAAR